MQMPIIVLVLYHVLMLFALILARHTISMPVFLALLPLMALGSATLFQATRRAMRTARSQGERSGS
jgi:hypothetical protein